MKLVHLLPGIALTAALAGCSTARHTVRHLASEPPTAIITLAAPAKIQRWYGETILPAGDYRPALEDDKGYYYQAPAKIIVNQTDADLFEGGLYVQKGSTAPRHYYVVAHRGGIEVRDLATVPQYVVKP